MGVLLKSYGLTRFMFLTSIIMLVLNVVLNIVLIELIGITGPAWATVFITYMLFFLYLGIIQRKLSFNLSRLFSLKNLAKTLVLSIAIGIPFWFLIPWTINPVAEISGALRRLHRVVLSVGPGVRRDQGLRPRHHRRGDP